MEITTPSGLRGEVRKLRGSEVNILSDKKKARSGKATDEILQACWTETHDPGPYTFLEEGGSVPWNKILVCDRFFTTVAIRIATYGPDFVFKTRCGESSRIGCGTSFEWEMNLKKDLPYYELPEESREAISKGSNLFEASVAGKVVHFRLPTGADEKRAIKLARQNQGSESITNALASRIVEIEDVGKRFQDIDSFLQKTDFDLQLALLNDMDEHDGGFETSVEVQCPECDNVYEVNLPFGGAEFWTPRKSSPKSAPKKKRRVARTMAETE